MAALNNLFLSHFPLIGIFQETISRLCEGLQACFLNLHQPMVSLLSLFHIKQENKSKVVFSVILSSLNYKQKKPCKWKLAVSLKY